MKYSVDEIRRMREAVEALTGSVGAEDRLRTYMQNETTVEELERAALEYLDPIMRQQRAMQLQADAGQRRAGREHWAHSLGTLRTYDD